MIGLLVCLFTGCNSSSTTQTSTDYYAMGYNLTNDPTLGSPGNPYVCITCHRPPESDRLYPNTKYPTVDLSHMAFHFTYWGDTTTMLRDAVNRCIVTYMRGTQLTSISDKWLGIQTYLVQNSTQADSIHSFILYDTLKLQDGSLDSNAYTNLYRNGLASLGAITYERNCTQCHSYGLDGAIDLTGRTDMAIADIAIKTRWSSTDYSPGLMPFITSDRLSVDSLKNIIAFIRQPR